MKAIKLEIDVDKAQPPLSARERVSIYLLLTILGMVFPARWNHDFGPLWELIGELKK